MTDSARRPIPLVFVDTNVLYSVLDLDDVARFVGHNDVATTRTYVQHEGDRPRQVSERALELLDPLRTDDQTSPARFLRGAAWDCGVVRRRYRAVTTPSRLRAVSSGSTLNCLSGFVNMC